MDGIGHVGMGDSDDCQGRRCSCISSSGWKRSPVRRS